MNLKLHWKICQHYNLPHIEKHYAKKYRHFQKVILLLSPGCQDTRRAHYTNCLTYFKKQECNYIHRMKPSDRKIFAKKNLQKFLKYKHLET